MAVYYPQFEVFIREKGDNHPTASLPMALTPSMCEMILMGDLYHDFRRLI